MPNQLEQRIAQFTSWREKLVASIDEFRVWQDSYGQADIEQTLRIYDLVEGLRNDRIRLAFMGESAEDKIGLINALLFADMPWMLSPTTGEASRLAMQLESAGDEPRRHGRLFAFGYDAWLLQAAMQQRMATGAADSPLRINGVTGILSVDADGIIHRELTLARINSGVAAAITP